MFTRYKIMFAFAAAAFAAPLSTFGQQQKVYRIGYLANNLDPQSPSLTYKAFVDGLRELGWTEGKNIEIRPRSSDGRAYLFPKLAAELVQEKVDAIVTGSLAATQAAKAATTTIPIVFASAANPVENKLVASLARPGGNVTGLALMVQELGPKRLQLLKEILPRATRFARLYQDTGDLVSQQEIIKQDDAAARALGVTLRHIAASSSDDVKNIFSKAARDRIDALYVKADALLVRHRDYIASLALQHKIPIMTADNRFAEAGALVSYGENFAAHYRRAAFLIDKILRGSKPADLPVEQAAFFELVINLKTAMALGITIPEPILLQADRVIR